MHQRVERGVVEREGKVEERERLRVDSDVSQVKELGVIEEDDSRNLRVESALHGHDKRSNRRRVPAE